MLAKLERPGFASERTKSLPGKKGGVMRRLTYLLLAFVLLAAPALAQQQYGSIAGTVVDNQQ
jgi:hypothetical protein